MWRAGYVAGAQEASVLGLSWQSSGYDSMLSLPGVQVQSLVRELRSICHTARPKQKKGCQSLSFLLVQREQLEH